MYTGKEALSSVVAVQKDTPNAHRLFECFHCSYFLQTPTDSLLGREGLGGLSCHLQPSPGGLALTCALGVTACPGAVDRAVSAEQARGVVAFATLIDNGAGEHQAIAEHHSGVAWSSGVPT